MYPGQRKKRRKKRKSKWIDPGQRELDRIKRSMRSKGVKDIDPQKRKLREDQRKYYSQFHNIIIKSPTQCTNTELAQFYKLSLAAEQVNTDYLKNRIRKSLLLAFYYYKNELVGIAALKIPNPGYKKAVFDKAGVPESFNLYELEIGYAFVRSELRGKGICQKIMNQLISKSPSKKIYATTGQPSMKHILTTMEFTNIGDSYKGKFNDTLHLYVLNHLDALA